MQFPVSVISPHKTVPRSRCQTIGQLKDEFIRLSAEQDRNRAGLAFESFLNRLFEASHLKPRLPFRVAGEQIDGSFKLDGQIYLLELKWEAHPLSESPLLSFRAKIEGKSSFTCGVFVAVNGITRETQDAITRGKQPSFFVMDRYDLMMALGEAVSLIDFLRPRVRLLAEEGRVCVPFADVM